AGRQGIEPQLKASKASVLPLDDLPKFIFKYPTVRSTSARELGRVETGDLPILRLYIIFFNH
ncbi:MAG: hypothetical protein UU11_C0004G0054, partial [Parcubacteria group bacterium GW2011_GWF2_40_69]